MKTFLRTILLGLAVALGASSAQAQNCSGQAVSAAVCGNPNASTGLPSWATQTALLDRAFGTTSGTVLNRGSSVWAETSGPTLGANGGTGGSIILNGATSGSVTIGAKAAAGTATIFNLPITNGSLNNVLITDGSGNTSWTTAGAGTVSSVGLSMPGIFTVSGSPVVGAGTLTATLATETANTVWAGPTTGAASAPTFRALVGADLPNPSSSTLGGIQSTTGVTHEWISTISTSGVPGLTQPAFTDISGSITPAQCPNPSASTIGCVESYVAVANQWINAISTSGVPSSTQPAFSNISGQTTLAQLPTMSNNTLLSNISGGSSTPLANSLTATIDSAIGATQGQLLYRSATVWTALSPGTSGQVLTTNGAASNPSWTSVSGTGTVTSVTCGTGLSGGTFTTSGTCAFANISTGNVLANVTGGSAAPSATTPTQVLDVIGSTQGSVLYRGAGVWTALTPGTSGQFLQTTGAGSTPQWASAVTSSGSPVVGQIPKFTSSTDITGFALTVAPQGRLTLTTVTPVMTGTVSAATTIYYTPYAGQIVSIFDGTTMIPTVFSEISVATTDTTKNPAAIGASKVNDWFVWNDAGTLRLGHGPDWTTDTARSAGTALVMVNGILLNNASITNGPAASRGTYVGTTRSDASSKLDWIPTATGSGGSNGCFLGVWNTYNRVLVGSTVTDNGVAYTYTTATIRQARASTGNQISFVLGLTEDGVVISYATRIDTLAVNGANASVGFGLDSTSAYSLQNYIAFNQLAAAGIFSPSLSGAWSGLLGYHTLSANEKGDGANAATFDNNNAANLNAFVRM